MSPVPDHADLDVARLSALIEQVDRLSHEISTAGSRLRSLMGERRSEAGPARLIQPAMSRRR
jgi:uncharacterized protein (UPF0335 family)